MSSHAWNLHCPHCQADSLVTHDLLMAGHTQVLLAVLGGGDAERIRRITEDFEVACPACGTPVPFEPRSLYRRRKLMAMSRRFTALADLEKDPDRPWETRAMSPDETRILDLTCRVAGVLCESLEGDYPLERVREHAAQLIAATEQEIASLGAGRAAAEPLRLLREMAAIAQADVGERQDLVDVSAEAVKAEDGRIAALLDPSRPAPAATQPAPAPASRSRCFIATAACGTPDHPLVDALRAFRDRRLLRHRSGRAFVRLYERLSPPLAAWIGPRPLARRLVRACLVRPAAFCARRLR